MLSNSVRANQVAAFAGLYGHNQYTNEKAKYTTKSSASSETVLERHDVFVGLPTGGRLLVTVLLPASS